MSPFRLSLTVVAVALILVVPAFAHILPDGGMEQPSSRGDGPEHWAPVPPESSEVFEGRLAWADDVAHGGDRSLCIAVDRADSSDGMNYNWKTTTSLCEAGRTYALSAWVKTSDLSSTVALMAQCLGQDPGQPLAFATTQGRYRPAGTTDWTRIWTRFTVPDGTVSVLIRAINAAANGEGGTAWFDDVELQEIGPAGLDEGPGRVEGTWQGSLEAAGNLPLVLHVEQGDGGWDVSLDSPRQNATGLHVTNLTVHEGQVSFELGRIGASFSGRLAGDGEMVGHWNQGMALPLTFRRADDAAVVVERQPRPQEPQPPLPYRAVDVAYSFDPQDVAGSLQPVARDEDDDLVSLHGTLTLPAGDEPQAAVLLITGSGSQDRDETLFGHKPFLVLADHLTRHGLAVLRVDDRGCGESTGNAATATTADLARDAAAGFLYLQRRDDIDASRVALFGHSEGGLIGPLVAAAHPDVAALVLMAGPGVDGAAILKLQQRLLLEAAGATAEQIATAQRQQATLLEIVGSGAPADDMMEQVRAHLAACYDELSAEERDAAGSQEHFVNAATAQATSPWMRWFMTHDPAPTLARVTCPVLAVNGTRDLQVDAQQNLPVIEAALAAAGNRDVTVVELPGLNHLFQTCETGLMAEYATIEETLAPEFLTLTTDWLRARLLGP